MSLLQNRAVRNTIACIAGFNIGYSGPYFGDQPLPPKPLPFQAHGQLLFGEATKCLSFHLDERTLTVHALIRDTQDGGSEKLPEKAAHWTAQNELGFDGCDQLSEKSLVRLHAVSCVLVAATITPVPEYEFDCKGSLERL